MAAKNFDLNKEIARHLCLAQKYSELAKYYKFRSEEYYGLKRYHISKAISLMDHNVHPEDCRFNYYIGECVMYWDYQYRRAQIVYFTYRSIKRFQISFHVTPPEVDRRRSYKGLSTKWDHKSSHYSCEVLKKIFNLKIEI